jgi:hypothetical protein
MFFRHTVLEEIIMRTRTFAGSVVAAALLSSAAIAQTQTPPAPAPSATPAPSTAAPAPKLSTPHWRSSKMIGVAVYNEQNERLGDINEILLDGSGKVLGYVVGVGGFLGMGEHDIFVEPSKIKFVNEPMRAATAAPRTETTGTTPTATPTPPATTTATRATRAANEVWYPDHGVMAGTKDQLKALPQFKYSSYN